MGVLLVALLWLTLSSAIAAYPKSTSHIFSLRSRDVGARGPSRGSASTEDTFAEQTCMTDDEMQAAVSRFSQFLQFRTVSSPLVPDHVVEPEEFRRLHLWMPEAYPEVWEAMEVEEVGSSGLSYLLKWQGSEEPITPSAAAAAASAPSASASQQPPPAQPPPPAPPPPLLPVLFLSHLDVVPVANETLAEWTQPPFSGAVEGGFIWGRGTLDVKVGVSALLEGATLLLREGWRPQRTLYFAFGQDEEVGGEMGAARIAQLLADRGVMVDMVYDEGPSVGQDGAPPYTSRPLAMIGTAEKGYATIIAQISTAGGHSSLPPLDGTSAAAIAARLVTSLDRRPPPATLVEPVTSLLAALAPATPGIRGILFGLAGAGLGGQVVRRLVAEAILGRDAPETAALVRNTAAVTGLDLGFAENVLPPAASVRINFRLLPGSNVSHLMDYLHKAAGSDMRYLTFELNGGQAASLATPVTSSTGPYFGMMATALQEVYKLADGSGRVDVAPTLMAGGTDSKHYLRLSVGGALRQTPVSLNRSAGDQRRVHGLNERVAVADFGRAVCVMRRLMQLVGEAEEQRQRQQQQQ